MAARKGVSSSSHDSLEGKERTWWAGHQGRVLLSLEPIWGMAFSSGPHEGWGKWEQDQMKGVPTLSHEDLLADVRRGDRGDLIIRRTSLWKDGKIDFVCLQGEEGREENSGQYSELLP